MNRGWSMIAFTAAALAFGCSETTPPKRDGLRSPRTAVLLCLDGKGGAALPGACTETNVRVYVGGGTAGSVAVAHPVAGTWIDHNAAAPGVTPFALLGLIGPMAADTASGKVYVALLDQHALVRLAPDKSGRLQPATRAVALPADATPAFAQALAVYGGRVFAADADRKQLWVVPTSAWNDAVADGAGAGISLLPLPGSPHSLAVVERDAKARLLVGYRDVGVISVVDLAGEPTLAAQPLPLRPDCGNGWDDDGDGLVDADDSGCDAPDDPSEAAPERGLNACSNDLDDDGDGATDAFDLGCDASSAADACRNGIDDDGDGQTDYPSDGGCAGFGDTTEASERDAAGQLLPANALPVCGNGLDDDGDGLPDLVDPDCWNRATPAEAARDDGPQTLLAASFDGRWLVAVDRGRRVLQVYDLDTMARVEPVAGTAPWIGLSGLDLRDGVHGLRLPALPVALTAVTVAGRQAVAVGFAGAPVQVLALDKPVVVAPGVALDKNGQVPAGLPIDRATTFEWLANAGPSSASGMSLSVASQLVDLGFTLPDRYARPGKLQKPTPPQVSVPVGVTLTDATADHRSETWRLTFEGTLPGSERKTGRLVAGGLWHDPGADFCRLGVVPGDRVHVQLPSHAACGAASGQAVRVGVQEVRADTLVLATTGETDVAVTLANQLKPDLAAAKSVTLPTADCLPAGVAYTVRASGWLVSGARTGLLSRRTARDGVCTPLDAAGAAGARLTDPAIPNGFKASCPPRFDELAALPVAPFDHPVFRTRIVPGCTKTAGKGGVSTVRWLPAVRDATWQFDVAAGRAPRGFGNFALPVAMFGVAKLPFLYLIDEGYGALYRVYLDTGQVVGTLP